MWDRETGKPYTSIEATADFNDLCLYKQSGLLFLANEQPKMQVKLADLHPVESAPFCVILLNTGINNIQNRTECCGAFWGVRMKIASDPARLGTLKICFLEFKALL